MLGTKSESSTSTRVFNCWVFSQSPQRFLETNCYCSVPPCSPLSKWGPRKGLYVMSSRDVTGASALSLVSLHPGLGHKQFAFITLRTSSPTASAEPTQAAFWPVTILSQSSLSFTSASLVRVVSGLSPVTKRWLKCHYQVKYRRTTTWRLHRLSDIEVRVATMGLLTWRWQKFRFTVTIVSLQSLICHLPMKIKLVRF